MDTHKLTPRQKEVTDLVLEGMSNKQIGRTLFIEEKTVKFHLTNIFKIFGVKTRAQLSVTVLKNKYKDLQRRADGLEKQLKKETKYFIKFKDQEPIRVSKQEYIRQEKIAGIHNNPELQEPTRNAFCSFITETSGWIEYGY